MTVTDVRHSRHRHGVQVGDAGLLELPEAQPIIARIAAAVDRDCPHWREHVERVATIAIKAKIRPNNMYARPTL